MKIPRSPMIIVATLFSLGLWIALSGCALRKLKINNDLFDNPNVFYEKTQGIRPEMTEEEFFAQLGLPTNPSKIPNIEFLDAQTIWQELYGNSLFQPGVDFVNNKGYGLPYVEVDRLLQSVMPHKLGVTLLRVGHDLKVIAIFDKNSLRVAKVKGHFNIHEIEEVFIWDLFSGTIQGGVGQGGKEAIKAL